MSTPRIPRPLILLSIAALACALAACKGEKPSEPPKPKVAEQAPAPARTKEQSMAALMAIPEIKEWSAQIDKTSHGKARGALIEDDPAPRMIDGQPYWQFSFVENRPERVRRVQGFLVAQKSDEVLVDDLESGSVLTLPQWRRAIHRVVVGAAE
jgi:hypothetical protein